MKMDMSGAAAVLSTMSALKALRCKTKVTAYLMCTDNMPSGSALKLGDVLTMRNGKTVEVLNTDAEGRLVLADGLSLAAELEPDAIVDIATLTGACLTALGTGIAGLLGNHQGFIDQVEAVSENVDEPVWQLPLATKRYRKLLDSNSADMKNIGGPYGGTITASIFLNEFVGRRAVGPPRHRRPDERRRRRRHLRQGCHRLRHPDADRSRLQLHAADRLVARHAANNARAALNLRVHHERRPRRSCDLRLRVSRINRTPNLDRIADGGMRFDSVLLHQLDLRAEPGRRSSPARTTTSTV